jgi:hypothetical protein
MQNAETVLGVLRERGNPPRQRRRSLESLVPRKGPAGFGGGPRGKGPAHSRYLVAWPTQLAWMSASRRWYGPAACTAPRLPAEATDERILTARPCSSSGRATPGNTPAALAPRRIST